VTPPRREGTPPHPAPLPTVVTPGQAAAFARALAAGAHTPSRFSST